MNLRQRINRLKREITPEDEPRPVVLLHNNPETARRGLKSEREGLIGGERYEAGSNETTREFHNRLVGVARARGAYVVSIGYEPPLPARYNLDSPIIVD